MKSYSRSHLAGPTLFSDLATHLSQERRGMAEALADIGEIEVRGLYRAQGYPSMYAFCVGACHMSDQAALKRINAARTAREFPAIFEALADGRLHLTAVITLASKLTAENGSELLAAAAHKTTFEIERMLAERFPRPDVPTVVTPLATPLELSPANVGKDELSLRRVGEARAFPESIQPPAPRPRVVPLSAERVLLKITINRNTHDKMLHAQNLLGHQLPSGALEQVLDRAIDALIEKLEKRKYGATDQPRENSRASGNPRYISAHVKRAVRERDRDRCTFVAQDGHRCEARKFLEFDHALPVARGGKSTIGNLRLRCRAHNQYAAEQDYGSAFMETKRTEAVRARGSEVAAERARLARDKAEEVVPWLQALGIRADQARHAAQCADMPGATLEERVTAALRHFGPRDVALRHAAPA